MTQQEKTIELNKLDARYNAHREVVRYHLGRMDDITQEIKAFITTQLDTPTLTQDPSHP